MGSSITCNFIAFREKLKGEMPGIQFTSFIVLAFREKSKGGGIQYQPPFPCFSKIKPAGDHPWHPVSFARRAPTTPCGGIPGENDDGPAVRARRGLGQ